MKKAIVVLAVLAGLVLVAIGYRAYLIHELRKPILAVMGDPDSALFRAERYFGNWTVKGGILCGQVNAKNKMGGYVGYSWYSSTAKEGSIEDDDTKHRFDAAGRDRCSFSGLGDYGAWWWLRY